jgi:hypothetical protein
MRNIALAAVSSSRGRTLSGKRRFLIANLPVDALASRDVAASESPAAAGLPELLRDVFSGGLAGLIAGIVFLGAGSRLVMRGVALLNPNSRGLIMDNGNVVGEITAGGTADLVIGTGLFGGLVAGALWVLVRDWLPIRVGPRVALGGVLAALLGSFFVVSADNEDFHRLDGSAVLNVAMFVSIIGRLVFRAVRLVTHRRPADLGQPAVRRAAVRYLEDQWQLSERRTAGFTSFLRARP